MTSAQVNNLTEAVLALPLGQAVKQFLGYLKIEAGLSDNTVLGYGRDLKHFCQHLVSTNVQNLGDVRPQHIFKYIKSKSWRVTIDVK